MCCSGVTITSINTWKMHIEMRASKKFRYINRFTGQPIKNVNLKIGGQIHRSLLISWDMEHTQYII